MILCKLEIQDNVQEDKLKVDNISSTSTTNAEATIDDSKEVHADTINSTTGAEASKINESDLLNYMTGIISDSHAKEKNSFKKKKEHNELDKYIHQNQHKGSHIFNDIDNTEESLDNPSENDDEPITDTTTLTTTNLEISSNEIENITSTTEKTIVNTTNVTETDNYSQTETSGKN